MSAIRITGTLGRDAEARFDVSGGAWLYLELHLGPNTLAVQARKHVGSGPSAQIAAASSSRLLRKGARVTVHAGSYNIAYTPSPHIVLGAVDYLEHQPVATVRRCGIVAEATP